MSMKINNSALNAQLYTKKEKRKNQTDMNFNGSMLGKTQDFVSGGIKKLDKGGFVAELVIADALGCVAPRVIQEYNRNKEELGHPNYQAAAETTGRECLTTTILILIPLMMLFAAKKTLGKGVLPKVANMEQLSPVFERTLQKHNVSDVINNNKEVAKGFFGEVFDENFAEHFKKRTVSGQETDELLLADSRNKFVGHLETLSDDKTTRKVRKDTMKELNDLTERLNLHFNENPLHPRRTEMLGTMDVLARDTVNYASGMLNKLSKELSTSNDESSVLNAFKGVYDSQVKRKEILNLGIFGTLGASLAGMPLLYLQNDKNPGVAGIKKEAVKRNPAGQSNSFQNKNAGHFKNSLTGDILRKTSFNKKHANTSFGASPKTAASAGKSFYQKLASFCEPSNTGGYEGLSLAFLAYACTVGGRYGFSRDKDEKRETLVRDVASLGVVYWGTSYLKKALGYLLDKKTQVPITDFVGERTEGKAPLKQILNPTKGNILSSLDDIRNWYCFNGGKTVEDGKGQHFDDWLTNLSEKMDLKKAFNVMGEDAKVHVNEIVGGNIDNLTSGDVLQRLKTTMKTEAKEGLKRVCANPENNLLKKAEFYRSIPQIAGIGSIVAILGVFLPWWNISSTREKYV